MTNETEMSILVLSKYDERDINGYNLVFNEYLADAQLIFFIRHLIVGPYDDTSKWTAQMKHP